MQDKFAGIDYRYYMGPGGGYKFLSGPKHFIVVEAGLNYVNEEYTDDTEKDCLGGRAFAKYNILLLKRTGFPSPWSSSTILAIAKITMWIQEQQ